jgi:hypothetical protein
MSLMCKTLLRTVRPDDRFTGSLDVRFFARSSIAKVRAFDDEQFWFEWRKFLAELSRAIPGVSAQSRPGILG